MQLSCRSCTPHPCERCSIVAPWGMPHSKMVHLSSGASYLLECSILVEGAILFIMLPHPHEKLMWNTFPNKEYPRLKRGWRTKPNETPSKHRQYLSHFFAFCWWRFPVNIRAVSAKIKLTEKYLEHSHILRTDKKNLLILLLPGWPRKRKLDLKLSIIQLKRYFTSVQNKMALIFSTFLWDLTSIFPRMFENLIAGSLEKWINVRCFK